MIAGYFDGVSGASGDMIVGALIDAGWDADDLRRAVGGTGVRPEQVLVNHVVKRGIKATHVRFDVEETAPTRSLADLLDLIERAGLRSDDEELAKRIVLRLGRVEADIHDTPIDQVHFHELSGMDTVLDIVGALAGIRALAIDRVFVSPLNTGSGTVRTAHGVLPVPAPATAELLRGFDIYAMGEPGERVTPTGAAILSEVGHPVSSMPRLHLSRIGYGAGTKEFEQANVLRLMLGETGDMDTPSSPAGERLTMLECNIDDMNPELYGYIVDRLFEAGALDAFLAPIIMKKGRPATMLSVLCRPLDTHHIRGLVFTETTTLGIREQYVERHALDRYTVPVDTIYGTVRVKLARRPGDLITVAPEYEDCRAAAVKHGVALHRVYRAAEEVARVHADLEPSAQRE